MNQNQLVMSIDIGTTSAKCLVINESGNTIASASHGYRLINRKPSWVEQNPIDWWEAVVYTIKECLQKINCNEIVAISLSGHMSALVLVDEEGEPLYPSILISDTRSVMQTSFLQNNYLSKFIDSTGNQPLDAFTVSKLLWIKKELPDVLLRTKKFFFPKDFVRFKLTNKMGTDPTDAGNSLLYNQRVNDWNWSLINELQLPRNLFPEIIKTTAVFGFITEKVAQLTGLKEGTPVVTGGADMACSQLGTGAIDNTTLAITLSTSGQVVIPIAEPHKEGVGKVTFHPGANADSMYSMGSIFTGGLGVEWGYKHLFNKKELSNSDYLELEKLTKEMENYSPGSEGVLFLPFLVGSGSPYFDTKDRGAWVGLTLNQNKSLLLHALFEGITFNILESVNVMRGMGCTIQKVHLGAGGSRNAVWRQMIADVLGLNVSPLLTRDGSSLGAAIIAATGIGMFNSVEDGVKKLVKTDNVICYNKEKHQEYQQLYKGYLEVYQALNKYWNKKH